MKIYTKSFSINSNEIYRDLALIISIPIIERPINLSIEIKEVFSRKFILFENVIRKHSFDVCHT